MGLFVPVRLDAGQNLQAELTQTNSAAQSYRIPVWHWVSTQSAKGGEGAGAEGGVTEEVRQRSMSDTALILLLSVERFHHSDNTGP